MHIMKFSIIYLEIPIVAYEEVDACHEAFVLLLSNSERYPKMYIHT